MERTTGKINKRGGRIAHATGRDIAMGVAWVEIVLRVEMKVCSVGNCARLLHLSLTLFVFYVLLFAPNSG